MSAPPRGVIIAAPASGAGKTTVTLGLLRALQRRGLPVRPFKCGPDYIDTAFHSAAARRAGINLDTWAMRAHLIGQLVHAQNDSAICVCEGMMGLYDGAGGQGAAGSGSTADLAAMTGWPVALVLDVGAQAETAAAMALGLKSYRSDVAFAGVILNNVGGQAHAQMIAEPMMRIGLPVLGALKRTAGASLPERHLGLVQADETSVLDAKLDALADMIEDGVDVDKLVASARVTHIKPAASIRGLPPPGQRIALARDRAFSFVYAHMVSGWLEAGAEVLPFSPLADEAPSPECDAVWLPGGYPELHAGALANAGRFQNGMRDAAARGIPIHGECGGYMVLGAGIEDKQGAQHAMLGLLAVETSFATPRMHLGYRRARVLHTGQELIGHEFHFSSLISNTDDPFADIYDAAGHHVAERGSRRGGVTGTFFHVIDGVA